MSELSNKDNQIIKLKKKPNYQYDMFSSFYPSNQREDKDYSNAIAGWDLADKYTASKFKIRENRLQGQELIRLRSNKHIPGLTIETTIKPAIVKIKGITYFYYPSSNEEVLEQILRKLFVQNKNDAYHNGEYSLIAVSKYSLEKEFKALGKTHNQAEISLFLEVLSSCHIEIRFNGKLKHSGGIISTNIEVDKDDDKLYIQLPLFLTASINCNQYSQYYFPSNRMGLLGRYMVKRFTFLWKNATYVADSDGRMFRYSFKLDELAATGLLPSRKDAAQLAIEKAFKELEKHSYITSYNDVIFDKEFKGRTLLNIKYTLTATYSFVKELKASSARNNNRTGGSKLLPPNLDP